MYIFSISDVFLCAGTFLTGINNVPSQPQQVHRNSEKSALWRVYEERYQGTNFSESLSTYSRVSLYVSRVCLYVSRVSLEICESCLCIYESCLSIYASCLLIYMSHVFLYISHVSLSI